MIRSYANSATRKFVEDGRADQFPGLDLDEARELMSMINAARAARYQPVIRRRTSPPEGRPQGAMGDQDQSRMADLFPLQERRCIRR
jgi:hypothetical protein